METLATKIVPHIWFDKEAKEAIDFYVSLFPDSKVKRLTSFTSTPSGDVDVLEFSLWGYDFMAINAGPVFTVNPSISFYVYCGSEEIINKLHQELSQNGKIMMPLDKYPWSEKYCWVQDKYGVSWQLDVADHPSEQKILPNLLFANEKMDKVKEAVDLYTSVFKDFEVIITAPHDPSSGLPEGSLLFAQVQLNGYYLNLMSSTMKHEFDFNEAVSLIVLCDDQEEIDYYWEKFTVEGEEQPCGWLKDKFGVSWQIDPAEMGEIMNNPDKEQRERSIQAMMQMKKLDIRALKEA